MLKPPSPAARLTPARQLLGLSLPTRRPPPSAPRCKDDGASSKEARTFCRATLKCLQRELTLRQFNQYGTAVGKGDKTPPHDRVVKRCAKEAAEAL